MTIDDSDSGEALARMFADPREAWGNLEFSVDVGETYAAIHWTGFDEDQHAVGSGFLIRMDGESPLGASDTRAEQVRRRRHDRRSRSPTRTAAADARRPLPCGGRLCARRCRSRPRGQALLWDLAVQDRCRASPIADPSRGQHGRSSTRPSPRPPTNGTRIRSGQSDRARTWRLPSCGQRTRQPPVRGGTARHSPD